MMWCGAAAHGDRFRTSVPGAETGPTIVARFAIRHTRRSHVLLRRYDCAIAP